MRAIPATILVLLLGGVASAAPLDLYDWMGPAPVVVIGDVVSDDARYAEVVVDRSVRGGLDVGRLLPVDVRGANRGREPGTRALEVVKERRYLFLLEPASDRRGQKEGAYTLVRGTTGAREIPLESGAALESAAIRLAEIQDRKDLEAAWRDLGAALLDPNPVLAETALDQHLKFRRGEVGLLAPARTLLLSPRPSVRARAATLAGIVLSRGGVPEDTDAATIADLLATARRDGDATVREAATQALGVSPRSDALEALKVIARDDPDQRVRYAAERQLFERSSRGGRVD